MSLKDRLQADVKSAMRENDTLKRDTLRMVLAALQEEKGELVRLGKLKLDEELSEGAALAVLAKNVKTRADSAEQYARAGRADLAERERAEIGVIEGYLPKQLSEDEVHTVVRETIEGLGVTEKSGLGQVMKAVLAKYKGQVDGKLVQQHANEILNELLG